VAASQIVAFYYSRPGGGTPLSLRLAAVGGAAIVPGVPTTGGALPVSGGNAAAGFSLVFQTASQYLDPSLPGFQPSPFLTPYERFTVNANGSWNLQLNVPDPGSLSFTFSGADGNTAAASSQFAQPYMIGTFLPIPVDSGPPGEVAPAVFEPIPEPTTIALMGVGLVSVWGSRRMMRKRSQFKVM
jgi:hypothetical protein